MPILTPSIFNIYLMSAYSALLLLFALIQRCITAVVCPNPVSDYADAFTTVTTNVGVTPAERLVVTATSTNHFRLTGFYSLDSVSASGIIFSVARADTPTW